MQDTVLREKLRKTEALFAGAATHGERDATEAAMLRVKARLAELERSEQPVEMQFSIQDHWACPASARQDRGVDRKPDHASTERYYGVVNAMAGLLPPSALPGQSRGWLSFILMLKCIAWRSWIWPKPLSRCRIHRAA